MTAEGLAAAIAYHRAHETSWRRDFLTESGRYIGVNDEPPAPGDVLGPVRPRGGPNGVIVRGGSIVAEWGDTHRADMTFSVAKRYLAALAGLALMRGLVKDLDDPVRRYALDDDFDSPQNPANASRHPIQLTNEEYATLWRKLNSLDHNCADSTEE